MVVVGVKPKPRVLLINFDAAAQDLASRIAQTVPTTRLVDGSLLSEVRQAEWDAAVVLGSLPTGLAPHLQLLAIDPDALEMLVADGWAVQGHYENLSFATEFRVPEGMSRRLAALVESDLLPLVSREGEHACYGERPVLEGVGEPPVGSLTPFLTDTDDRVLAGKLSRADRPDPSEIWFLPQGVSVFEWFQVALHEWERSYPERFPTAAPWRDRVEWQTPEEMELRDEEAASQRAFEEAQSKRDRERERIQQDLNYVQLEADRGIRRLILDQGNELVQGVIGVLREFGFTQLEDMDGGLSAGSVKKEDIRVWHHDEWVAVVEVRGYRAGGAKLNDLLRVQRFVNRFTEEHGRRPSASWYVVNHFIEDDPSSRPRPLVNHPEEVGEFALGGGLVIDTRDLFTAWRKTKLGALATDAVLESLRSGDPTGWWCVPDS